MAARTVLFHSLAFNEPLKGLSRLELNYSLYAPAVDPAFVDKAVRLLQEESEYLDDSGTSKLRFLTDANLNQMARKREGQFDLESVREELNRRIGTIFAKQRLEPVLFASSPADIPDDTAGGAAPVAECKLMVKALPQNRQRIAPDQLIAAHQGEAVFQGLGDQESIEGVLVHQRQTIELAYMGPPNRQQFPAFVVNNPIVDRRQRQAHIELAQMGFNLNLPEIDHAAANLMGWIGDGGYDGGIEAIWLSKPPDQDAGVKQESMATQGFKNSSAKGASKSSWVCIVPSRPPGWRGRKGDEGLSCSSVSNRASTCRRCSAERRSRRCCREGLGGIATSSCRWRQLKQSGPARTDHRPSSETQFRQALDSAMITSIPMTSRHHPSWREVRDGFLADPEVQAAYEELASRFAVVRRDDRFATTALALITTGFCLQLLATFL